MTKNLPRIMGLRPSSYLVDPLTKRELEVLPHESGQTVLSGPLPDQTALHGVLMKIRDWGLPLVAVNRVEHHE